MLQYGRALDPLSFFVDPYSAVFLNADPDPALKNRSVTYKKITYEEFAVIDSYQYRQLGFVIYCCWVFFSLFSPPGSGSRRKVNADPDPQHWSVCICSFKIFKTVFQFFLKRVLFYISLC